MNITIRITRSTFTIAMARTRQETWGKEKRFREGQTEQVLDTLFFDFIDVVRKLRPKVVIAENVKGLLQGAAKKYVQRIHMEFEDAGYTCQHFLLDAQSIRSMVYIAIAPRTELAYFFTEYIFISFSTHSIILLQLTPCLA